MVAPATVSGKLRRFHGQPAEPRQAKPRGAFASVSRPRPWSRRARNICRNRGHKRKIQRYPGQPGSPKLSGFASESRDQHVDFLARRRHRLRPHCPRTPGRTGPAAPGHHRGMDARRNRTRARTAGAGAPARRGPGRRPGAGRRPGDPGPRPRPGPGRDRGLHAPVRPGQRGRRAADVRGRGAAAHSRPGHRRQADPRQAGRRGLEASTWAKATRCWSTPRPGA